MAVRTKAAVGVALGIAALAVWLWPDATERPAPDETASVAARDVAREEEPRPTPAGRAQVPAASQETAPQPEPPPARRKFVAGLRIVDEAGAPIEGARVTVRAGPRGASGTSDADGVAVLRRTEAGATAGVWGWFDVTAEGYAKRQVGVRLVADDGSPLDQVVLQRPSPVSGWVTDQDGRPVAGCGVNLRRKEEQLDRAVTGEDGEFVFPDATAGRWELSCGRPEPMDAWGDAPRTGEVTGGASDVRIVLRRLAPGTALVKVEVVEAATGKPLPVEDVRLVAADGRDGPDEEPVRWLERQDISRAGGMAFERVRPGRYLLWVRVSDGRTAPAEVQVADGARDAPVRVEVPARGRLRGRVESDPDGPDRLSWLSITRLVGDRPTPWADYCTRGAQGGERISADRTFEAPAIDAGRWRLAIDQDGWVGETVVDVPPGAEVSAVVAIVRGGTIGFRIPERRDGPLQFRVELAGTDGEWREVGPTVGRAPGTWRWRVTFPEATFAGPRLAAETQEGEVEVVAGETAEIDLPFVRLR